MKCTIIENRGWKKDLNCFLLVYRTTAHTVTGTPPSDILFGYKLLNNIAFPSRSNISPRSEVDHKDAQYKKDLKTYIDKKRRAKEAIIQPGESVLVKRCIKKQHHWALFWNETIRIGESIPK